MQEIIVFSIAALTLIYLYIKLFGKRKSHDCGKCGLNDNNEIKGL